MASFSHYKVENEIQIADMTTAIGQPNLSVLESMKKNMKIEIIQLTKEEIVFDLIGVDASIANALRRILVAEVPTVAFESIFMSCNTSIIQDEVLAHRIGLIPLNIDPSKLQDYSDEEGPTDLNTIVFKLDVVCKEPAGWVSPDGKPYTEVVYSRHLEWQPQGGQAEVFVDGVHPVHPDIVIALLRPGQSISFEGHCRRGVGKDHAKFSPVATAFYKLKPDIGFYNPVTNELADELKSLCPANVFDIEELAGSKGKSRVAVAARPRDCTMCRECTRTNGWENNDRVKLQRAANHFIFSVESTGCIPPEVLVQRAIEVLKQKAVKFLKLADEVEDIAMDCN